MKVSQSKLVRQILIGVLLGLLVMPPQVAQAQWAVYDPAQYTLQLEKTRRSRRPELEFATVTELEAFFKNEPVDLEEIDDRRNGYAAFLDDEWETHIVTGSHAAMLKEKVREESSQDSIVRGNIANRGHVTGRVRIISFNAPDYDEQVAAFQEGEILVTGMTRPQIVHLCAKAVAIVTDEGGITCHASIVSREFNIPCIIATHNATKVLVTGDQVVVDATKGLEGTVVKINFAGPDDGVK